MGIRFENTSSLRENKNVKSFKIALQFYDLKYFLFLSALTAVTHFAIVGLARLIESVM